MVTIDPELIEQFENQLEQPFELIVRTNGDVSPHLAWFDSAGIAVKQKFRLTPGVAISCTGAAALRMLSQDWVKSVEPDQTITTM